MKKKLFTIALSTLLCSSAFCALPPMPQSLREIKEILSHDFLRSDEMTTETIWQIQKVENGYVLETNHFIIPVEIIPLRQEKIGPAPFQVHFDTSKLIAK